MINSKILQSEYIKLYKILREYSWPIYVVQNIADLEIAIFQAFPTIDSIVYICNRLKSNINGMIPYDSDQRAADQRINSIIELCNSGNLYYRITKVDEVI